MLEMLHLDVSKVDLGVAHIAVATYAYFIISFVFRFTLQMFHLDVSKVDRVLHVTVRLLLLVRHCGSCADA
jgi:hypothetical protein